MIKIMTQASLPCMDPTGFARGNFKIFSNEGEHTPKSSARAYLTVIASNSVADINALHNKKRYS